VWRIQFEFKRVGNEPDPDIGGKVVAPDKQSLDGFTIEFVERKTKWTSGKVPLKSNGVFFTQLEADEGRLCTYDIELCDPTGAKITTTPHHETYKMAVEVDQPPAAMTIGIGLATGEMKPFIPKGTKLPTRKIGDLYTTVDLRAGVEDDVVCIPLLEGEHRLAERNHGIGEFRLRGSQIKRDLPAGSPVEVTIYMDQSQMIRIQVFVNSLDEDYEAEFDPELAHNSIDVLTEQVASQEERLSKLRGEVDGADALKAQAALNRLDNEQLQQRVNDLIAAATNDPDAVVELDRRIREMAAAIDDVEDAVMWPKLLEEAKVAREDAEKVVDAHGEGGDKTALQSLVSSQQSAIDTNDADLLRRCNDDLDALYFTVLNRQDYYHVHRFEALVKRLGSMQNPSQAQALIARGRRAIENNDVNVLKAVNRQLNNLLSRDDQKAAKREGGVIAAE